MTQTSVVRHRGALWYESLQNWGYEPVDPDEPDPDENPDEASVRTPTRAPLPAGALVVKARRMPGFGDPRVTITIREYWRRGFDPEGLQSRLEGYYLDQQSWHAQFDPAGGPRAAERLDLDRSKARALRVHRHPLGEANSIKTPAKPVHPNIWLEYVGSLAYRATAGSFQRDERDERY